MPSLGGFPEVPCARCGKRARIQWGELCPICQGEREERAVKLSRWIALAAAFLVGVYTVIQIPVLHKWYAAVAVAGVYLITRRLATRLAIEFLPRDWEKQKPAADRPE